MYQLVAKCSLVLWIAIGVTSVWSEGVFAACSTDVTVHTLVRSEGPGRWLM
jgi:hypothetical protein